jgi:spore coat protein CotH
MRGTRSRAFTLAVLVAALLAGLGAGLAGCGSTSAAATTTTRPSPSTSATASTTEAATAATVSPSEAGSAFLDSATVHEISVSFSQDDYDAMIQTFKSSGSKDWIKATVTVDGTTFKDVGMRLKGNSSIMGLRNGGAGRGPSANISADQPETLPWLIRLDKNVDGQSYNGITDLVVRSNTSATSLNEAVALQLLGMAGLASLDEAECRFSVNGGTARIRLVTQLPNDDWMQQHFSSGGALYKADASGDYSYRGTDPTAYEDVFEQEAGNKNADLTPLIDFLDFINNSDDATFNSELAKRLDVDSFATYLAMEELVANFDDIDGPGNNSYLYYDPATKMFTVVPWDHNLAFGAMGGRGGAGGQADAGATAVVAVETGQAAAVETAAVQTAAAQQPAAGQGGRQPGQQMGGVRGKSNILVTRFHKNADFEMLYQQKLTDLRAKLYASGAAQKVLDTWVEVLKTQASDLLTTATIDQEASRISAYFTVQ